MSNFLRQATAAQVRAIGPFLDDTDFKTAETGLTIANTDIKLVVNGAASANKNSGGGTHRVNGVYGITFDATDTATVGEMEVSVVVAGALPVFKTFFVVEEAVYDMLFAATAPGYVANAPVNVAQFGGNNGTFAAGIPAVNAAQISGDATAADNLETAFDDTAGPVPWLGIMDQGTAQAATSTTIQLRSADAFPDDALNGCVVLAFGSTQGYWQARLITDYVNSTDTATVDAWAVTPSGTVTYKVFAGPAAPSTLPNVNVAQISGDATAADNAESFFDGTGYAGTNNTIPTVTAVGTVNALANNSLTAAAAASDLGTELATAVWANGTRVLTAGTNLNDLSAAGVRAAVGLASANLDTQIGTLATAANLATVAGYLDTEIAAILADTNELQTDWANGGRLDNILDARASQTSVDDLPTNGELATALAAADDAVLAAIAALNNLSAAQVNAEVVDALNVDTYAEPGQGAPAATASLAAKIGFSYKFLRNKKTQTASQLSVFADDGTTVDHKAAVSDDGTTTTVGEIAGGP